MQWYEVILAIASVGLLIPMIVIIVRHFPQISAIEVEQLPEEKQQKLKIIMAEARLRRKFQAVGVFVVQYTRPLFSLFKTASVFVWDRIRELEVKYKIESLQNKSVTQSGKESLQQKITLLLKQGRNATVQGEFEQAEDSYLQAIQLEPKSVQAFEGLGEVYIGQKKYEQAREVYQYILKMMNEQGIDDFDLSSLKVSDSPHAAALVGDSEKAVVHFQLGQLSVLEGDQAAAITELDKALEYEPNNPRYLDALLDICIIKKDKLRAQELFFKLEQVNPDNKKLAELKDTIDAL